MRTESTSVPSSTTRVSRNRFGIFAEWLLAFVLVVALGWFSKAFTRETSHLSAVWLANGVLIGFLLTADRSRWVGLLSAGFLANVLSGLAVHDSLVVALIIATFNTVEVAVAVLPQRRGIATASDLTHTVTLIRFACFSILLAPLVTAALVGGLAPPGIYHGGWDLADNWFIGHALGIATMVPVTLALRRDQLTRLFLRGHPVEACLLVLLVLIVTTLVFAQSRFPLLFLIFPPMLLVAIRGGFAGTAGCALLVVVIAVSFTVAGFGPLTLMRESPDSEKYLVLQVFIGSLLLSLFPVVVNLAERRRAHRSTRDVQNRLRLLAEYSNDVIVLTDVGGRRLYVSPAVEEVFGWTQQEFLTQTYRDLLHPEDMESVNLELSSRDGAWTRLNLIFRATRADGREIWVESQIVKFHDADFVLLAGDKIPPGQLDRGADGTEGRVVTLRDITRRRQAELALEAANIELASLVWKDGLTGLANRRRYDEAVEYEWERGLRAGSPLAILLIDVDYFKNYNDHYGHQQGDHCLLAIADAIASGLYRPSDLAARYGGEEFAVILSGTEVDDAARVAERIRRNLSLLGLEHGASPLGNVTLSIGVAGAVPRERGSVQDIVKAADQALYTSKHEGRDRTTVLAVNWPEH